MDVDFDTGPQWAIQFKSLENTTFAGGAYLPTLEDEAVLWIHSTEVSN
jgi:hypothetical protein